MFKCQVVKIIKSDWYQRTYVKFKVSGIGNPSTRSHKLTGKDHNNTFTIDQIDNSIKVGDLLRCDGLPYMSKPPLFNTVYTRDSNGTRVKYIRFNRPEGYRPFRLESGYWVLRKVK
jgi:hypothetical protein